MHYSRRLWSISWISFLWSTSSLMVFSILPAFLTEELQTSHAAIGVLEGVSVACAFFAKVLAGIGSDFLRRRKPLILLGTVLSLLSRPIFAIAMTFPWLFLARFLDRLSKGVRSSPTDALIADCADSREKYGSYFGLRQSLYTAGAVLGACLSIVLMHWSGGNYRLVFACAVVPMALSTFWVAWGLPEGGVPPIGDSRRVRERPLVEVRPLPGRFWFIMLVTFCLMMARFSEAFVTLRARELGWPLAYLPAVLIIMEVLHTLTAYPAGRLADRYSRPKLLFLGLLVFILTNLAFIFARNSLEVTGAIVLLGFHLGMTQGLLRAMVAEVTPAGLRGTAFAIFYLVSGLAVLLGNIIAGGLSQRFGLAYAFAGAGVFIAFSVLLVAGLSFRKKPSSILL